MSSEYQAFLVSKKVRARSSGFAVCDSDLNAKLFPFQKHIVKLCLQRGKSAIFSECGTGKTPMQLDWARLVCEHTNRPVLVLCPLAVAAQTVREGAKFGIGVTQFQHQSEVSESGIWVTNYDRLKGLNADHFGGVVLDESSILKSFTGATKRLLLKMFDRTPYKLACTATPAPNDHMELGNHAEFLNVMPSNEMLSRWFLNDTMKAGGYRLKHSGEGDFWAWVASWAIALEKPSDIGFEDDGFILPKLNIQQHTVYCDPTIDAGDMLIRAGDMSATSLHREMRITAHLRAERVAEMVNGSSEKWIVWCNTNYEADELTAMIPEGIEVRGSESADEKERKLSEFTLKQHRVIITKPSIAGFGLNWEFVHNMAFAGLSYSYEQLYQAMRRAWRYGQTKEVHAHIVTADSEGPVLQTILTKQKAHERMKIQMVNAMQQHGKEVHIKDYEATKGMILPAWMRKAS
jgi:hypothetical protein